MITLKQAMTVDEFHFGPCGPNYKPEVWHRMGPTKLYDRERGRFHVPVRHGLHRYGAIDNLNADLVHTAEQCPLKVQQWR